jgi:hypothetical protein
VNFSGSEKCSEVGGDEGIEGGGKVHLALDVVLGA